LARRRTQVDSLNDAMQKMTPASLLDDTRKEAADREKVLKAELEEVRRQLTAQVRPLLVS
jgi:hypothetical protein